MRVLVVNAGSSSLKLRLLDEHDTVTHSANLPAEPDPADVDVLRDKGHRRLPELHTSRARSSLRYSPAREF